MMVILKQLPFVDILTSMQEIAALDTVANLKKHLTVLHSWVPSDYRKADYAMTIHAMFLNDPIKLANALPSNEQEVIVRLTYMKADEYLTWPLKEGEELVMQTLHLVITYEDGKQWRFYMPDCIRQTLAKAFDAELMYFLRRM
ncbi:hypothetical protein [Prevotella sp. CAG:255]|uniref:hypothetical protein n=1 Tax=Prevotella sp. CAG:255 TaxID=1262923 RepID=UPI00258FA80C|nr:hypothetical protein [Prevotella sp. CAG:255]